MTYLEFLYLPAPDLMCLDFLTLVRSSPAPNDFKVLRRDLVFGAFKLSTTSGNSGTDSTLCPLAMTNGVQAEAARAAAIACLLWVMLHFLCHFLQILSGANILAFLHMLPKVAYPDLEVPDPEILGILATALPVPHDSAECSAPAL